MGKTFRELAQAIAETAVLVFGSLFWGSVLVAASLWVWFGIGYESSITAVMGVLGLLVTLVGLLIKLRSKDVR